jgi:hypothetical protein
MKRRIGIYVTWSRPLENNAQLGVLENRFPALFELRRVAWPHFEKARELDQGVAGFLDNVILTGFSRFREVVKEETGAEPILVERVDAKGKANPLTDDLLGKLDTLVLLGLDHFANEQRISDSELSAVQRFLRREGTCLIASPHHDVGATETPGAPSPSEVAVLAAERAHHGDPLVPPQQRLGLFVKTLLEGIGLPIRNRFGLKPAVTSGGAPEPLEVADRHPLLEGVVTLNAHAHLPHFEIPSALSESVRVLARQKIDTAKPHPFTDSGATSFNALLWAPPAHGRAGDVLFCDATTWSSHFGGLESLERLWRNVARM